MTIKKTVTISILFIITSHLSLKGQIILDTNPSIGIFSALQKNTPNISFSKKITFLPLSFPAKAPPLPSNDFIFKNKQHIPYIYSYDDLAFFCKIEVKLEKANRIPFKFRLGSVDYVDQLEGKRRTY